MYFRKESSRSRSAAVWSLDGILLSFAIFLFPLYVFPSGGLQPTHLVFLLLSASALSRYGIPDQRWLWLFIALAVYTVAIELYYAVMYNEFEYTINSAFFAFNCAMAAGVYHVVLRRGSVVLRLGILAAAGLAFVVVYSSGVSLNDVEGGWRSTGAFNNPNQLGYFSTCLLSLSYLLYRHGEVRLVTMLVLVAASLYLAVASLSKAAIIANLIVLSFVLQSRATSPVKRIGLVVLVLGGFSYLLFNGFLDDFLFLDRILNMGNESDSSLEERGYFAFLEGNPWQVIPGIGSSEVRRIVGHEVHSTFASVLNTYGVIGLTLFVSLFIIWGRQLYRAYGWTGLIALQGPAVLYGITHNGTRFSIFWLLFAASMALATRVITLRSQAFHASRGTGHGVGPRMQHHVASQAWPIR